MFDTVLIANRGEIASRIARTLRRLGIRSVAVYSDADGDARHVSEADLALRLGPAALAESYLNTERIVEAALAAGADAVHPGYGFLAENAGLASACAARGLIFIGPSPHAIEVMGDKIRAKTTVAAAGVPVVPGRLDEAMSDSDLVAAAAEIGFPVLVKPSAGGGGKGMRVAQHPGELAEAVVSARREAASSFGDDTLFVERYLDRPRHIEVQVLADNYGTTLHLGERECSLQRRHQKVIEEAPSPSIDQHTRQRLGAAAVAAARSVDYRGVGTVEFIVAAARPEEFFFMEMNTRLQVEHPVTEAVTGLDLVEQQLRVAAGEALGFGPDDVEVRGHAIEARIYAEDPSAGFLPTGGRVLVLREPEGEGIRVDSSLSAGLEVATSYDPMLAKVVAWAPQRSEALARLEGALSRTVILGVVTNVSFLRKVLAHPDVVAGRLDTGLIERERAALTQGEPPDAAYATYALWRLLDAWPSGPVVDPWDVPSGFRPGRRARPLSFVIERADGTRRPVGVSGTPVRAQVWIGERPPAAASISVFGGGRGVDDGVVVKVDGVAQRAWVATERGLRWVFVEGAAWVFREATALRRVAEEGARDAEIRSPMPGTVIALRARTGALVAAGDPLMVVEAMKMEHVLLAPFDGEAELLVAEGEQVALGDVVARVHPGPQPEE